VTRVCNPCVAVLRDIARRAIQQEPKGHGIRKWAVDASLVLDFAFGESCGVPQLRVGNPCHVKHWSPKVSCTLERRGFQWLTREA